MDRRHFIQSGTAAGVALATTETLFGTSAAIQTGVKPVVVASDNGNVYKNGGTKVGVQLAFEMITKGSDVLDALIAGVNLCELDPEEAGVGYGGLPNADGVVQLDSCCMHGPKRRAGGVAALEGVRTPSLVAKAVMEQTDAAMVLPVDIGTHVVAAAQSVISRPVADFSMVRGDPAEHVGDCRHLVATRADGTRYRPYPWPQHRSEGYPFTPELLAALER